MMTTVDKARERAPFQADYKPTIKKSSDNLH